MIETVALKSSFSYDENGDKASAYVQVIDFPNDEGFDIYISENGHEQTLSINNDTWERLVFLVLKHKGKV